MLYLIKENLKLIKEQNPVITGIKKVGVLGLRKNRIEILKTTGKLIF